MSQHAASCTRGEKLYAPSLHTSLELRYLHAIMYFVDHPSQLVTDECGRDQQAHKVRRQANHVTLSRGGPDIAMNTGIWFLIVIVDTRGCRVRRKVHRYSRIGSSAVEKKCLGFSVEDIFTTCMAGQRRSGGSSWHFLHDQCY